MEGSRKKNGENLQHNIFENMVRAVEKTLFFLQAVGLLSNAKQLPNGGAPVTPNKLEVGDFPEPFHHFISKMLTFLCA